MSDADFKNACLVLAGHGSTVNADSSASVRRHAEAIRDRGVFAQVLTGFLKEAPFLSSILQEVSGARVFVVPFFVSEGYFTEHIVPQELGVKRSDQKEFTRVQRQGQQLLVYCKPVGTHARMTEVILSCAQTVVASHPFPRVPPMNETTLFIAGHGTELNAESRRSVEHQVEIIRHRGLYADVHAVFLEEEPRIETWHAMSRTRNVIMVPFFLSDGLHAREDIPVLLGEQASRVKQRLKQGQFTWRNPTETHNKCLWYSDTAGSDSEVTEVILERVREAESLCQGH